MESVCGARLRSKTTYVPFCSYRGHVLYACLCFVDVCIPWIVDLPLPWSVYAVVNEVLFILVRLRDKRFSEDLCIFTKTE